MMYISLTVVLLLWATKAAFVLGSTDQLSDEVKADDTLMFGINLGVSYLQVALTRNGTTELIPDTQGRTKTPFIVSYHESGPVVGWEAQEGGNNEQGNMISNFGNLLGKNAKQATKDVIWGQEFLKIVESKESTSVEIVQGKKIRLVSFEELLSELFLKLKRDVYAHTGKKMLTAIAAVPNGFGDDQRRAINSAGELAGIKIIRSMSQYVAGGLAHSLEKDSYDEKVILFIHVEDHTIEFSIASVDRQVFEMFSHYIYNDYNLTNWDAMSDEFDCENSEWQGNNQGQIDRWHQHNTGNCSTAIDKLDHRHNFGLTQICPQRPGRLIQHFWKIYTDIMHEAEGNVGEINVIVITGDIRKATRVKRFLRALFPLTEILDELPYDECSVRGAAKLADHLLQWDDEGYVNFELSVLGLGIGVAGGAFQRVLPKHYILPRDKRINVTTVVDKQTRVDIPIYEGDRYLAERNKLLATISMDQLPLAPRGTLVFEIAFRLEEDRMLEVMLLELGSGRRVSLGHLPTWGVNEKPNLDELVEEAELAIEKDKEEVRKLEASPHPPLSDYGVQVAMKCNFDQVLGRCLGS